MDIKKNDILTVEITDTGTEGEGIGKLALPAPDAADTEEKAGGKAAGFTLFVKDAVIGDTVQVKVMKAKKNYAYAKLEKVLVPSPFRVQPPCPFTANAAAASFSRSPMKNSWNLNRIK